MNKYGMLGVSGWMLLALFSTSAFAVGNSPNVDEEAVFGYPISSPKLQVVTGEAMLAEAPARFDGFSSVNAQGQAISSGIINAETTNGPYSVRFTVFGRAGESISTIAEVNGKHRTASVRIAAGNDCSAPPCAGAVRIRVEGEDLTDLEIYLPAVAAN